MALALTLDTLGAWPANGLLTAAVVLAFILFRRFRDAAVVTAAVVVTSTVLVPALKWLIDRERPVDALLDVDSAAFPSGHTAFAAALATATGLTIAARYGRATRVVTVIVVLAVVGVTAWSRMFLAVHWLSDTVAGALLGAGVAVTIWRGAGRWARPSGRHPTQSER